MKSLSEGNPINILLADDDKDDRFFFEEALKKLKIAVQLEKVTNGEHLMDYLSKNSANPPDVLFLDLNMPRMNGAECLIKIKSSKKLKQIPVVIYSTSLQKQVADILYQRGAHYYLQKSNFRELAKNIEIILTLLMDNPNQPALEDFIITGVEV